MMYRVIGILLVLVVVGVLYFVTEGLPSGSTEGQVSDQPLVQPSSSDNDFKNLKIN